MSISALLEKSNQCLIQSVAKPEFQETIYEFIVLSPIWLIIAILLSPVLLTLYRRRIVSLMNAPNGDKSDALSYPFVNASHPDTDTSPTEQPSRDTLWKFIRNRQTKSRRHILTVVLLHLSFLVTIIFIANQEPNDDPSADILSLTGMAAMLLVWSGSIFAAATKKTKTTTVVWLAGWITILITLAYEYYGSDQDSSWDLVYAVAFIAFVSALLHLGFSHRHLRNIVPYLTVALTLSSLVALVFYQLSVVASCIGQSGETSTVIAAIVGVFVGILAVRSGFGRVADLYARKRLSDQQIQICCWLIVISLISLILLQVDDEDTVALKPISFLIPVSTVISILLYLTIRQPGDNNVRPQKLLLLRVFSTDNKREKWLDSVEFLWRHIGPIYLIAGPDLAKSGADPDELFLYVTGKIRSLFIAGHDAALDRLGFLDNTPDPDGRYRVNEFFCFDNSWETVAKGLVNQSDSVVLDLREFDLSRVGTAKEIDFLAKADAFSKTLILTDSENNAADYMAKIEQLTGLKIDKTQFVVPHTITADVTIKRILSLQSENLSDRYQTSTATLADYYKDISIQVEAITNKHRQIVATHQNTRYGFSYLIFSIGLVGMVYVLAFQLLAPLYLLIRGVALRRIAALLAVSIGIAICMTLTESQLVDADTNNYTLSDFFYSAAGLAGFLAMGAAWFLICKRVNSWIHESKGPLRSSLKYVRQLESMQKQD